MYYAGWYSTWYSEYFADYFGDVMDMERSEQGAARASRYEMQHMAQDGHLVLSPSEPGTSVTDTVDPSEDRPAPLPRQPSQAPQPESPATF